MNAVTINHLTKSYGTARGITDIHFSIPEGEFFGFIGPNGAGKSTTIRTLLGLISPSGGTAELLGKNILREKTAILAQVGYMPSEASFYHNRRVGEIIKLSASLRRRDCSARAARLCQRLDLDPEKRISQLSLGNRKKVSIVCALQHDPKLCILDEPTSGLDPLMQREFFEILKEHHENGATVFLSSHVLSEVQRYCKHAAVIREGRLLVSDRIEALGHTDARRVMLRSADASPALQQFCDRILNRDAALAPLPEQCRGLERDGNTVTFLYSGKPGPLLSVLASLPLTDISIREPDLEEIFMHYYGKDGQTNGITET